MSASWLALVCAASNASRCGEGPRSLLFSSSSLLIVVLLLALRACEHVEGRSNSQQGSWSPGGGAQLPPRWTKWDEVGAGDDPSGVLREFVDRNRDGVADAQELQLWDVGPGWFQYYDRDNSKFLNTKEWFALFRERRAFVKYVLLQQGQAQGRADAEDGGVRRTGGESEKLSLPTDVRPALRQGHREPLGVQGQPVKRIRSVRAEDLNPDEFWTEYVEKHVPVLLRDVESPAATYWDEAYVVEKFGNVALKLEPKKENRGSHEEVVAFRGTIAELLDPSGKLRDMMYAVTILPQSMMWETVLPKAFLCGSRKKQIDPHKVSRNYNQRRKDRAAAKHAARKAGQGGKKTAGQGADAGTAEDPLQLLEESWTSIGNVNSAVSRKKELWPHPFPSALEGHNAFTHSLEPNLWVAGRPTKSQLHYDKENIFFCVYRGWKDFFLIDTRKYGKAMQWVRGGNYNTEEDLLNRGTDWVAVDVDSVDLNVYPELQNVTLEHAHLRPGDCLFQPFSYLHYVRSNLEPLRFNDTHASFVNTSAPTTSEAGAGGQAQLRSEAGNEAAQPVLQDFSFEDEGGASNGRKYAADFYTHASYQISASFLFSQLEVYDKDVCEKEVLPFLRARGPQTRQAAKNSTTQQDHHPVQGDVMSFPAAVYDTLWHYTGAGVIPQGYPDPAEIGRELEVTLLDEEVNHKIRNRLKQRHRSSSQRVEPLELAEIAAFEIVRHHAQRQGARAFRRDDGRLLKLYSKEFAPYITVTQVPEGQDRPEAKKAKKKRKGKKPEVPLLKLDLDWRRAPLNLWLRYAVDIDDGLDCNKGHETYYVRSPKEHERMEQYLRLYFDNLQQGQRQEEGGVAPTTGQLPLFNYFKGVSTDDLEYYNTEIRPVDKKKPMRKAKQTVRRKQKQEQSSTSSEDVPSDAETDVEL
ncbi:unnamed protein product [Amoebophrya sp. A120]|nr:unnamed protein product [Amoebophrya sp. A120]|eukprot:GSA120T00023041001.1